MKTVKLFIVVALVLIITLNGCATETEKNNDMPVPRETVIQTEKINDMPVPEKTITETKDYTLVPITELITFKPSGNFDRSWYDEVIAGFGQKDIETSIKEANAVAEYRVVYDVALLGYFYYTLQVYADGTGKFTFMVHHGEYFDDGELLLNKALIINKDDTEMLLKVISDNDFWNIPTVHPDEELGCDGTTVFIEGYLEGNTHFIRMWEPGEEFGIYKIFRAFDDYSAKIADNPLREYAEEYE